MAPGLKTTSGALLVQRGLTLPSMHRHTSHQMSVAAQCPKLGLFTQA